MSPFLVALSTCLLVDWLLLLIQRSVILASPVVGPLLVHAEGIPGGGAEDLVLVHVVHAHGDAQHGGLRSMEASVMRSAPMCP